VKSDVVTIKKYGNRRLYDTSTSQYINLEKIATLVRNGKEVRVVDAQTGKDLTRVTLTQIIVEDAKDEPTGLPLALLRQLIVASDRVGREFVMWYLNSAFSAYHKVQESLQSGLSEVRSAVLPPLPMTGSSMEGGQEDNQALGQRIEQLEARLKKPARQRTPRKATR
jgi:polyhydroxyalkanoate synthesis repressor PhaR